MDRAELDQDRRLCLFPIERGLEHRTENALHLPCILRQVQEAYPPMTFWFCRLVRPLAPG